MGQRELIAVGSMSRASRFPVRAAEVLAANRTVTADEIDRFQVLVFGPNAAARTVTLPAEESSVGALVVIVNLSTAVTTDITVNNDAAAAVGTVPGTATPAQPNASMFVCDGTAWYGLVGA